VLQCFPEFICTLICTSFFTRRPMIFSKGCAQLFLYYSIILIVGVQHSRLNNSLLYKGTQESGVRWTHSVWTMSAWREPPAGHSMNYAAINATLGKTWQHCDQSAYFAIFCILFCFFLLLVGILCEGAWHCWWIYLKPVVNLSESVQHAAVQLFNDFDVHEK